MSFPFTSVIKPDNPRTALREVAEFLAGQTLSVDVETVAFAQHFPRFAQSVLTTDFWRQLKYSTFIGKCSLPLIFHGPSEILG